MHSLSVLQYIFLTLAACMAGLIDSIAGSGGLISLPALLGVGMPPAMALGTNRLQGGFGELVASIHYVRSGELTLANQLKPIIFAVIGSSVGTILVQKIPATLLQKVLPIFLLAVVAYIVFSSKIMKSLHRQKISSTTFAVVCGLGIGFYNGFIGPGTGSFWTIAFVIFMGFSMRSAAMHAKPVNFCGNMASLFWFWQYLNVNWLAGIVMILGQLVGSTLGSKMVIHKGDKVVKPIFLGVVILMCVELIYRYF